MIHILGSVFLSNPKIVLRQFRSKMISNFEEIVLLFRKNWDYLQAKLTNSDLEKIREQSLRTIVFLLIIARGGWAAHDLEDLKSPIFQYQHTSASKEYLHVRLEGLQWYAVNVKEKDQDFIVSLFSNYDVMKWYGAGPLENIEEILDRTLRLWIPRFNAGQPHGALLVLDKNNHEPLGFIMGGLTDTPGVAAVAYAYAPHSWGRGIGSDVLKKFMEHWGPEVRRIGLGDNLDGGIHHKAATAFQCFQGHALNKFLAVVSPDNKTSLRMLEKVGYKNQPLEEKPILNLMMWPSLGGDTEAKIRTLIKEKALDIKRGQFYKMIDEQGYERIFMIPERYDRIKYYLEVSLS